MFLPLNAGTSQHSSGGFLRAVLRLDRRLLEPLVVMVADYGLRVMQPVSLFGAPFLPSLEPALLPQLLSDASRGAWAWAAFQGFGAMAGFTLAALTIVLGAENSPRMRGWRADPLWTTLLRSLVGSMWAWMLAAIVALACWLVNSEVLVRAFLGVGSLGVFSGLRALLAVTVILRRFEAPANV